MPAQANIPDIFDHRRHQLIVGSKNRFSFREDKITIRNLRDHIQSLESQWIASQTRIELLTLSQVEPPQISILDILNNFWRQIGSKKVRLRKHCPAVLHIKCAVRQPLEILHRYFVVVNNRQAGFLQQFFKNSPWVAEIQNVDFVPWRIRGRILAIGDRRIF